MRISVLTYNTADKQASLQLVHSIIQDTDSDIIFISLQEMYNLDSHFVIHKKGYTVSITKMIGMVSILLTKAHTKPKILKIGMGPFGFPNKGFILHSFNGTLFINCHLPAHEGNNEKRMVMIGNILDIVSSIKNTKTIVVAGDMNFRVNGTKENRELLDDKEFDILKLKDECKEFKEKYDKFTEGDISFEPTYKFVIGSDQYDKKRFPSWCDRVFIASKYEKKSLAYKSLDMTYSDHRPVYAEYEIDSIIIDDNEILEHKKVNYLHKVILTHIYCFIYEQLYPILIVIIVFIALLTLKRIHKPIVNNT